MAMMRRDSVRHGLLTVSLLAAALVTGCGNETEPTGSASTPTARPDVPATNEPTKPQTPVAASSAPGADEIDAALDAAHQYLDGDDLPRAEAVLAVLLDKAPREARAHELLGQVLARRGVKARAAGDPAAAGEAYAEAYEHYAIAVELDADSAGLQQSAGIVAHAAGLPEEALAHYRAAASLDPRRAQYPLYAAQVLIETKRYDEATTALDTVIVLDPDEPIAHASLAIVALEQGRYDEALSHIAEARRIVPGDLRFRAQEARIHRRRGAPEMAVELLEATDEPSRATEVVAVELAESYGDLDRHADAAMIWEQIFRRQRGEPRAYRTAVRAGQAHLRAGSTEAARRWLSRAKILAWSEPEVKDFETEFLAQSSAEPDK